MAEHMGVIVTAQNASGNGRDNVKTMSVTVNYTDGTSENVNITLTNLYGYYVHQRYPTPSWTCGSPVHISESTDETTGETVRKFVQATSGNNMRFLSNRIAINPDKVVESLTFNKYSSFDYYILAISEFASKNVDLLKSVSTAEAITNDILTTEELTAIEEAEEAMEILKRRNYSHDWTVMENLIAKKNFQNVWHSGLDYVDLSAGYNADTIAAVGDNTTKALWYAGAGNEAGMKASNFTSNVLNFTALSNTDLGLTYTDSKFMLPEGITAGGVADAVYLTADTEDAIPDEYTIDLRQEPTASVRFAARHMGSADGAHNIQVTVEYEDGTEVGTVDIRNAFAADTYKNTGNKADKTPIGMVNGSKLGWTTKLEWGSGIKGVLIDTTAYADTEADAPVAIAERSGSMGDRWGIRGLEFDVDESRVPVRATIQPLTGELTLYAATQYVLTNDELTAAITAAREAEASEGTIKKGIAAAKEAIVRGLGTEETYADLLAEPGIEATEMTTATIYQEAYVPAGETEGRPSIIKYYKISKPIGLVVSESGMIMNDLALTSKSSADELVFAIRVYGDAINVTDSYTAKGYVKYEGIESAYETAEEILQFPAAE